MADIITTGSQDQQDIPVRWLDQGDGTYALKTSTGGSPTLPGYPFGATPVIGNSGTLANVSGSASLPAVASRRNYIQGFTISGSGATGALVIECLLIGIGTNLRYEYSVPAGATIGAPLYHITFPIPLPASAVNTAIQITLPAFGAGNTNATVNIYGYLI